MVNYMVTIRCSQVKKFITVSMLRDVMLWLKMSIDHMYVYKHVYETSGKYQQLHMHSIVSVDKGFTFRPYTAYGDKRYCKPYHIDWTKIQDITGAYKYLAKDQWYQEQNEILIRNEYKYHYYNIDSQEFEFIAER